MNVKKCLTAAVMIAAGTLGFSLPGVVSPIPDTSGEYVFYEDKTFNRESIVGFLYYSEASYAIRYYAPATESEKEKDITLYISVNPDNPVLELTGETFRGADAGDADLVNYLRDLFYDFTAQRKRVIIEDFSDVKNSAEAPQFGGDVVFNFSAYVPLFNIESVNSVNGTYVFRLQTAGLLTSSDDQSFASYKGTFGLPEDSVRDADIPKAKKTVVEFDSHEITIDEGWTKTMENLWTLKESSLLIISKGEVPEGTVPEDYIHFLRRRLLEGTSMSYSLWQHKKVEEKGNSLYITCVYYQPSVQNRLRTMEIVTLNSDNTIHFVNLTVYDYVYQKNRKYFDKIIKSYKEN
ncbi:hypothetical protein [Treponema sp.]|uniref:hypothetical protein n=1 Tax=Treponema sp. TaxID=166 RepID=UPI00257A79A8|nr:hypothetical protein [Treponema sp.]MBE6354825.1 hypothetical protein [Treponema sp.]